MMIWKMRLQEKKHTPPDPNPYCQVFCKINEEKKNKENERKNDKFDNLGFQNEKKIETYPKVPNSCSQACSQNI